MKQQVQYAGRITVTDASGAHFQIHEYRGRRLFRLTRRFVLETGEPVKCIDFDNYVVAATGERLERLA